MTHMPQTLTKQYLSLLATYLRPQWLKVLLMAMLLVSDIGLTLANPQILRYYIDTTQSKGPLTALLGAALIFLAIAFAGQIVASLATYCSQDVGWTATNRLRSDLLRHCLHLDMSFSKSHTPGEMIERVDKDTQLELLVATHLSYTHPHAGTGIQDISLRIPRGSFTVITGQVGAGKTTLLRVLLGLLPRDSGDIYWNGIMVPDPASFFVPPRSAYTPQVPRLFS